MRDEAAVEARRLGEALALRTVSPRLASWDVGPAFATFRRRLVEWFPAAHRALDRVEIGEAGALLYEWRGADAGAPPWLFISHQDVVDAPDATAASWTHPPFSGAFADGFVWGRGAIDLKVSIMAVMEALERLCAAGFAPRRSVFLAFGADEETGGATGAGRIAAALRARGVRFAFSLDEGGVVTTGALPGIARPVAAIGVCEKGYLSVRITCAGRGGHSSMPGVAEPVARLVALLARIAETAPPARLDGPTLDLLRAVAPAARAPWRLIYRNAAILAPILARGLGASPATAAAVRTTVAVTMLRAGEAENAIAERAVAVVNYRLRPRDGIDDILDRLGRLAARFGATIEPLQRQEASPTSTVGTSAWTALIGALADTMPDALAAPCLTPNGTDSRHYEDLADQQYRFLPVRLGADDLGRIHGVDERISASNYLEMIAFYEAFIRRADALAD
jgi:carboxypeptidase PM20D1